MKIVQTGHTFRVYNDSISTYDQLPAQSYLVNFSEKTGFFLTLYSDIEIKEKVASLKERLDNFSYAIELIEMVNAVNMRKKEYKRELTN